MAASGLIAVRVEIHKKSGQELLVEPAGVQLRTSGQLATGPIPTSFFTAEHQQAPSISATYAGEELLETRIGAHGQLRELLFFAAPRTELVSAKLVLRIPVINPALATRYVLSVPVTGNE